MSIFFPARATTPTRAREATYVNGDVDADGHLYRRVGAADRDLLGTTLARAQNLAVNVYRSNPLANRIIKIHTSYMAGTGFGIACHNPEVQEACEEAWTAPRNQLDRHHRGFARDFLLFGEGIHPVAVDNTNGISSGVTTVGFIDPTTVQKITRSPANQMLLEAIILDDAGMLGGSQPPLRIVTTQANPLEPGAGLLVGDAFAWLHDRIGGASRGTPFLLPTLDWLDAYDQTIWELLERVKAVRAFFWNVKVDGGQEEVDEAKTVWGTTPPRSGSVRFSTKAMEIEASQPQIGAYEDAAAARLILRHIAVGAGVAPHWLGDPEDANRSTADSMDQPVLRGLADMQHTWKMQMEDLLRFVVDQKVNAGALPAVVDKMDELGRPVEKMPARDLVEVQVPAITDDDVVAAAGALAAVAQAFQALDMVGVGDPEITRRVVRQLLPSLGIPADELPDPDEDTDETIASALESITREAARGKLEALLQEIDQVA